jgi:hypothetical protein
MVINDLLLQGKSEYSMNTIEKEEMGTVFTCRLAGDIYMKSRGARLKMVTRNYEEDILLLLLFFSPSFQVSTAKGFVQN